MYAEVTILDPVPPNVGRSYPPLEFGKYGVFVWVYQNDMRGPIHWINWRKNRIEPEYKKPIGYCYWFAKNVKFHIDCLPTIDTSVADSYINNTAINLLTGKGLPFRP